jgi:predicted CoA-binding protein
MADQKKTLVLGASANPERYSHLAINKLRSKGHPVVGIGKSQVSVGDVAIETEKPISDLDTVSVI